MLRGWKSASCSGFPAPPGATGDDLIGNLPAKKDIPMLSNQRLRPIPLMNPPVFKSHPYGFPLSCDFFYIVYFPLSKWDNSPGSASLKANANVHDARRP